MFTRKQRLNDECTHAEYYAQFINESVKDRVIKYIGLDAIKRSTDEHMNDIPLVQWDAIGITRHTGDQFRACGDYPTLAGSVSLYKTAAKQIKAEL